LSATGGTWNYARRGIRLEANWRDFECGIDLSVTTGHRVEHRYFDGMDALFVYHELLEEALLKAGWTPIGYVSESKDFHGRSLRLSGRMSPAGRHAGPQATRPH